MEGKVCGNGIVAKGTLWSAEMNSKGCGWWWLTEETSPASFPYIWLQTISFLQTLCLLLLTSPHLGSNL